MKTVYMPLATRPETYNSEMGLARSLADQRAKTWSRVLVDMAIHRSSHHLD
jgi:hypothetical protein